MKVEHIVIGMVLGGIGLVALSTRGRGARLPEDVQINPNRGAHRGLAPIYGGEPDNVPTRMASAQDVQGGPADYLGYNYGRSTPSVYAKGEPARSEGAWWDQATDRWNSIAGQSDDAGPLNYGEPPMRIPKLWKDANRYWDSISAHGGSEVVGQRLHLFHLRPSIPTRGMRSISGSLSPIGGGQSTASRIRIPAIFVPSTVS